MAKNKNKGKPRNYALDCGVYRFGRSATYRKKAIYKFTKKTVAKKEAAKKPTFVEKKIGGAKNGGTRMVRVKKSTNNIPTQDPPAEGTSVNFFSKHKRNVRKSLAPGVIAILLAGAHKGKRVIVLKQLKTGLLLVTGPHKVNGVPLRRVNQRFMLATSTKIDVSGVEVPNKINDQYFARLKKTTKKEDGDISEAKKEERAKKIEELKEKREAERKSDQATVDKQVLEALKKNEEGKALKKYLKASFSLRKGQFPHKMAF